MNESDSSGTGRPAGSDSGRPACDWEQAFNYWATLPPQERTYEAVAKHLGVSRRTVETHGRDAGWRKRLAAIEAEAAALADARLAQARAQRQILMEQLIGSSYVRYAELLDDGGVEVRPADFVRIANLDITIGAATAKTTEQPASRAEAMHEVMLVIRTALADHPEAVAALLERLEDSVDG